MSLWIKICGNTSLDDAMLAAANGADAVGFVFAKSPRHVSADQVERMAARLPDSLERIGVFVDASLEEIESTIRACGLTGVQLHFRDGLDAAAELRGRFGTDLRILKVLHYAGDFQQRAAEARKDVNVDALLVDSRTATAAGGTGVVFDWNAAAAGLEKNRAIGQRIVVAGGLTPLNVAEAVAALRPWGVDVVSGVESTPGRKDPERVRAFIANARAASAR